jgi:hypothetical protein
MKTNVALPSLGFLAHLATDWTNNFFNNLNNRFCQVAGPSLQPACTTFGSAGEKAQWRQEGTTAFPFLVTTFCVT